MQNPRRKPLLLPLSNFVVDVPTGFLRLSSGSSRLSLGHPRRPADFSPPRRKEMAFTARTAALGEQDQVLQERMEELAREYGEAMVGMAQCMRGRFRP